MPIDIITHSPDTPLLNLLRVLLLYNPYDYHTMLLYLTRSQQSADLYTDILDIVHHSPLAVRVLYYETLTWKFRMKRSPYHLNVVFMPTTNSINRLTNIDSNFLSHDDHIFVIQFMKITNDYIYQVGLSHG